MAITFVRHVHSTPYIRNGRTERYFYFDLYRCHCGRTWVCRRDKILYAKTRSCGCSLSARQNHLTHGMSGSPEYQTWVAIRQRCGNPRNPAWKYYGGRGIRVCARWRKSFLSFWVDMGMRPSVRHSIDRIDNLGHYAPGNCRWATWRQQRANQRARQ